MAGCCATWTANRPAGAGGIPNTCWRRTDPTTAALNALEVQAFIKSTHAVTGDPVFEKAFNQVLEWNYHQYAVRQKNTFPPHAVVPWDDELAFESYYTLLRYVKDPAPPLHLRTQPRANL